MISNNMVVDENGDPELYPTPEDLYEYIKEVPEADRIEDYGDPCYVLAVTLTEDEIHSLDQDIIQKLLDMVETVYSCGMDDSGGIDIGKLEAAVASLK